MKIALYEPDLSVANKIKSLTIQYFHIHSLSISIYWYPCAENLIQSIDQMHFDLFILTIEQKDSDIKSAQKIRNLSNNPIIIISSSDRFALWSYSLNAVHYLLKPIHSHQLEEALIRSNVIHQKESSLEIKVGHKNFLLPQKEINYIEVWKKVATIYTNKNSIKTYSSLELLYSRLDHTVFFRPQRSFLVNMNYIAAIQKDKIVLNNQVEITLSRIERNHLKQQYQNFIFHTTQNL